MKNSIHCRAVAFPGGVGYFFFFGARCGLGRENRRVQESVYLAEWYGGEG